MTMETQINYHRPPQSSNGPLGRNQDGMLTKPAAQHRRGELRVRSGFWPFGMTGLISSSGVKPRDVTPGQTLKGGFGGR
jgi:hypothetical protein